MYSISSYIPASLVVMRYVIVCQYSIFRWSWVAVRSAEGMIPLPTTYSLILTEMHHTAGVFTVSWLCLFPFKQPTRRTNFPNLFCYKKLHVSGIFSAHHQEFSTVHSALVSFMQILITASKQSQDVQSWPCLEVVIENLVSFMQIFVDRSQAESGCSILALFGSGHQIPARNLPLPNEQ